MSKVATPDQIQGHRLSPVVRYQLKTNHNEQIFHRVVLNVIKMLSVRGYDIPEDFLKINQMTPSEMIQYYTDMNIVDDNNNKLTIRQKISQEFINPDGERIYVAFMETPQKAKSISAAQLESLNKMLEARLHGNLPINKIMVIAKFLPSNQTQTKLRNLKSFHFQFFTYDKLSTNVTENFLVTQYIKMNDNEVQQLITNSGSNLSKIKKISFDDPIIKYYGWVPGDVIEITRENYHYLHISPITKDYRLVTRVSYKPNNKK